MAEKKPKRDSEPLSLHGMTPEEAIQQAFGTKPPKRRRLTKDDREHIRLAVESTSNVDHRIIDITADEKGRILVRTGELIGPPRGRKGGGGQILEATQSDDGEWLIKKVGGWIS
jgi:hypothetical protein